MTSSDCQLYADFNGTTAPATLDRDGQAVGAGCVYPSNVKTLATSSPRTTSAGTATWTSMGNNPAREQARCGVPHTDSLGQRRHPERDRTATSTPRGTTRSSTSTR